MTQENGNPTPDLSGEKASSPDSPFLVERMMREAVNSEEEIEYTTEVEFREAMTSLVDGGLLDKRMETLKTNPVEMAQELAYQAYECKDPDEAEELVAKALELHSDCVDALTLQAFLKHETVADLLAALEHAATCGEDQLGEEFFAEFMGDFWPMVEARPYMRTIKQLAEVLWNVGRRFDAVDHYTNLLDLDPDDHMGNSSLLLGMYLSMGEVQRSWDLLEEYDDDRSAVFHWGWLLLFIMTNDEQGAHDALKHAMEVNPYVAPWFLGMAEFSEDIPAYIALGSEAEAQVCAQVLAESWERNPDAQMWLHQALSEMGLISDDEDEEAN
jgi:tetratricopeptide (TPR) repeat protein